MGPDGISPFVHSHSPLLPGTFSQTKYQVLGISVPSNLKGGTHHRERLTLRPHDTPWTVACQASLSFTISRILLSPKSQGHGEAHSSRGTLESTVLARMITISQEPISPSREPKAESCEFQAGISSLYSRPLPELCSSAAGHADPLQCSCLENPRDVGAWWAAVYGAAQSRTSSGH